MTRFDKISKPPPDGDTRGWSRWFYRVCELLNGTVSGVFSHDQLTDVLQADDTSASTAPEKHVTNAQLKVYGDHVRVTNANPHGTDHSQLDALSADDHAQYLLLAGRVDQTAAGPLRFGGAGNYTEFEADGSMLMAGNATVFDDLVAAISGTVVVGTGVSVNGAEQRIEYLAAANTADYAWTAYQMKHSWKPGSVVQPHIHWEQAAAQVPNWLLQYRWQVNGGAKVTGWTNYKCNTAVFPYVSGTLNQICTGVGITPPANYNISDILQIRVIRDTTNTSTLFTGADPYSGTVSAVSNDCHLEFNRLGSRTEYAV